jgi:hypothetical protein
MEQENFYLSDSDTEDRIQELESRLEELEKDPPSQKGYDTTDLVYATAYVFGSALAMTLSWARNASLLYCLAHGLLSWVYVAYFALTR